MDQNTEMPLNTVDGIVPIDPVEQQRKEEFEKKQKEIAEANEILKQTKIEETESEQEKQYTEILSKRENEVISIEQLVTKSFKLYPCLQPSEHTKKIYYGAQNSLVSEIDITAVGTTADEAVNAYIVYAERNYTSASFKVYPITNALYNAIIHRSEEKVKLNQFPKAKLLVNTDIGYDTIYSPGMVDLVIREYPYPTVEGILTLTDKLKERILNANKPIEYDCKDVFLNLYWGEDIISYIKVSYNETGSCDFFMNSNKITISQNQVNDILFNTFYGKCTNEIASNINNFTNLSIDTVFDNWKNNSIFTMMYQFVLAKNDTNLSKEIAIQCIYTHQDMPPKLTVFINV